MATPLQISRVGLGEKRDVGSLGGQRENLLIERRCSYGSRAAKATGRASQRLLQYNATIPCAVVPLASTRIACRGWY